MLLKIIWLGKKFFEIQDLKFRNWLLDPVRNKQRCKQWVKSKFYKKRGATFFYDVTLKLGPLEFTQYTVKSRVEARVTIQKIKSLGVLQTETCH